ncbi:MAG: carboxylating nicotinate-nucleotide diphosphorylase [Planctomycetota bacterium]
MEFLPTSKVKDIVNRALKEDIGKGDITTLGTINCDKKKHGVFIAKEKLILCGIGVVEEVFRQIDTGIHFVTNFSDGDKISSKTEIAQATGKAASLLIAERTALNFLCRLSGIATTTSQFVRAACGTKAKILDTRKTTPTMRFLEKYAVHTGGGTNHRAGLYDQVLIKDNHKRLMGKDNGKIFKKIGQLRKQAVLKTPVEVEVATVEESILAVRAGCEIIMLDNMSVSQMKKSVAAIRREAVSLNLPAPLIEASGRISLENVKQAAETGVDRISIGSLTHSSRAVDISFEIGI